MFYIFTIPQGNYVETKSLHGSQKHKWIDKNTLEVRLEVIPNYELERMIISFAEEVKIIRPVELKNRIREPFRNALKD